MVVRPAKFQNATKQTQEPPPPLPHSRPVTPQPFPTSVAFTFAFLVGVACAVVANAKPATRKTTTMKPLIRSLLAPRARRGARCVLRQRRARASDAGA